MKKIITILSLAFSLSSLAQAPQKMSYQAVIRNSSNALVTSSTVGVQISILQGTSTGTAVYIETQLPTTNANGLVSLEIGSGAVVTGSFSGINWANGPYFIKTETDPAGGSAYSISGTTELLSVPYALYAANSPAGAPGTNGTNGLSAYDVWLGLGNTGTQADFINSLTGPSGTNGTPGMNGTNGLSAYDVWLGAGNTGTQTDFISSLTGPSGTNGTPGTNGNNGLSAYDVWLGAGNTGTQTDFINSLTGPQGLQGIQGPQGSSATVTLTAGTNVSINGSSSNYTISSIPVLSLAANTLSISGSNSVVIAPTLSLTGNVLAVGPPTNTISLPAAITPTIIGSGVLLVSQATANTFTLHVPAASITSTSGIASVTSVGTNSFNINVPAPTYNSGTGILSSGASTISITPALSVSGNTLTSGISSNSVIIAPNLSLTGNVLAVGPITNTVNLPAVITPTINGTGIAAVSPTTGNNFTVNVPVPIYTPSTAALVFGTNTVIAAPSLTYTNNILSSGPGSNSVTIAASPWTQTGGTVTTTSSTVNVGINTNIPSEKLDVNGNVKFSGALMPNNASGIAGQVLQSAGAGAPPTWTTLSSTGWILTGNAGTTAGTNFLGTTDAQDVVFKSNSTEVFRAQSAGIIRMLAGADRTITIQGQTSNIDANALYLKGSSAGIGGQSRYGGSLILQGGDGYNQSNSIHFGGNVIIRPGKNQYGAASYNSGSVIFQNVTPSNAYAEVARIDPNGNMGIGVTTPTEKLEVAGNIQIPAANDYKYSSPKTKYASVSPASFSPLSSLLVAGNNTGNARWVSSGTSGVATEMFATVQLPDGALLNILDVYTLDNDPVNDVYASLIAYNMSSNSTSVLGTTFSTSGAVFAVTVIGVAGLNHVVDNSTYSYFIVFNTRQNNANLWIRGARVTYTITKAN